MIRALLVAVLLAGCGGSSTTDTEAQPDSDDARLAQAICNDLSDGMSMFQMHSQAVSYYMDIGRTGDTAQYAAAQLEDLATREYCPEFRSDFEATAVYEEWVAD